MKLSFILCFICMLQVFATSYSQTARISLSMHDVKIEEVLDKIEEQSEFFFLYNQKLVDMSKNVSIDVSQATINEVLNNLFDTEKIDFAVYDRQIILSPQGMLGLTEQLMLQQTIAITGIVTDANGEPLPGVTVAIKGTSQGTATDANGAFSIQVQNENAVLVFSYIGFNTQEIPVGNKRTMNVTLTEDTRNLDEVVIVGYGVQRKINLSGAVDQVTAKQLEVKPIVNLAQGLQGVLPNLNIQFAGGKPGEVASLNIRGMTSINGGSPLVMIDGISSTAEDLNRLAPGDVEEISVLKDASSAAIYGARASYGVILVQTKRGKAGKTNVSYTSNFEWATPTILPDKVSDPYISSRIRQNSLDATPWAFATLTNEQFQWAKERSDDPSLPPVRLSPLDNTLYEYMGGTDWTKHYLDRYNFANNHQLAVSGGMGKTNYYVSANYADDQGPVPVTKDSYKRYGMRSNIAFDPWKFLNLSINTSYTTTISDMPVYLDDWYAPNGIYDKFPTEVDINPNGTWTNTELGRLLAKICDGGRETDTKNQFISTFQARGKIIENVLDISANFMYRRNDQEARYHYKTYMIGVGPDDNREEGYNGVSRLSSSNTYKAINIFVNFNKQFGKHGLSSVIGYNQEWEVYDAFYASRNGLISSELPSLSLANGDGWAMSDSYSDWAIRALFGRVNYTFNDRYIVEFNGRYDGSSRFPKKSRFGFFPSASVAWRLEQENFMAWSRRWLNQFKLRGSYGSLGNQASSNYGYINNMTTGITSAIFGDEQRMYINVPSLVSANYSWETVTTINGGLDLAFLNNKLNFSFDIYRRDTKNMLTAASELPAILGTSAPNENAADLKTTGFELSLGYNNMFYVGHKPFEINGKFILSDSRSVITRFDNPTKMLGQYYVGQEIGELWGLVNDGFFRSNEEIAALDESAIIPWGALSIVNGWPKYVDQDVNGKIELGRFVDDSKDAKIIGNTEPRFRFGFTLGAAWYGFDLNVFIQGIAKKDYYPVYYLYWGLYQQPYCNTPVHLLDFYREADDIDISGHSQSYLNAGLHLANHDAQYPVLQAWLADRYAGTTVPDAMGLAIPQTKYLMNSGYARLKNLTLGYTLPKNLTSKWAIERFRIYASGENMFTLSEVKRYFDPEAMNDSYNAYTYPFKRKYIIGLNITF